MPAKCCDCGSKKLADLEKRLAKLEKNDRDLQGRFRRMRSLTGQLISLYGQAWAALFRGNLPLFWKRLQAWSKTQMDLILTLLGLGSSGGGGNGGGNAMDLSKIEKKLDQVYKKANDAAFAAQKASQGIAETRKLANDAAAGIRSVSNKVTGAERKILATLAAMSIAIGGVAAAAAAAVSKSIAVIIAGLSGLVQAAIAELKLLSAGFAAIQAQFKILQQVLSTISSIVGRIESKVDGLLNRVAEVLSSLQSLKTVVDNVARSLPQIEQRLNQAISDVKKQVDNLTANLNGTRTLLESRIQGVLTLLRRNVSGSFTLPTPQGGLITLPFSGESFDGLARGVEAVGNGLSRTLQRLYQQKIIDVFKFNAQIYEQDQDGSWQPITKEITSIKVGNDATHIFDSQVLVDLQDLKRREQSEPVLALADVYGLSPGEDRPVLVIAYRQKLGNKWGRSTYALSLFHPSAAALQYLFSDGSVIEPRTVGKAYASLTLKDGSRLKVMSPSSATSKSYLQYLLQWVNTDMIPSNYLDLVIIGETYDPGSQLTVYPRKLEYYSKGQRANISPDRQKYFNS